MLFFIFLLNPFNDFLSNFKDYKFSSNKSFYCHDTDYKRIPKKYYKYFSFNLNSITSELIFGGKITCGKNEYIIFEEYFPDGISNHSPDGSFIYIGFVDKNNSKVIHIKKLAENHLREVYNLIFFPDYILLRTFKTSGSNIRFMDMPKNQALITDYRVILNRKNKINLKVIKQTRLGTYIYDEKICKNGIFLVN